MAPIRHQPHHARQATAQSVRAIGPYPVEFCDDPRVGPTCETSEMIFRGSRRLFARDFDFAGDQVSRWIFPKDKVHPNTHKWTYYMKRLRQARGNLQRAMFGSQAIIEHIYDFIQSYEQAHPDGPKVKDMTDAEREQVWDIALTDDIAETILKPLAKVVKVKEFLAIDIWKRMYQAMFKAAAEIIYMEADVTERDSNGYPKVNGSAVYAAVRKVPDEKFPDRPQFDYIPNTSR